MIANNNLWLFDFLMFLDILITKHFESGMILQIKDKNGKILRNTIPLDEWTGGKAELRTLSFQELQGKLVLKLTMVFSHLLPVSIPSSYVPYYT